MRTGDARPSVGLLDGVDPAFVEAVLARATTRELRAEEVVYDHDDPARDLYVVTAGQIAISFSPAGLVPVVLAVLSRPAVFGTGSLPGEAALRRSRAIATMPSAVLVLPVDVVLREAERFPSAALAMARGLAVQVAEFSDRICEALQLPAAERVRRRLHALAVASPDGVVTVTQHTLAGLAGTSRSTANRVLSELEEAGVVRHRRGTVEVLDAAALLAP